MVIRTLSLSYIVLVSAFCFLHQANAEKLGTSKLEIQHLLEFVKTSGCDFIRNGKVHHPDKAYKHIDRKYQHFINEIHSAEDFIEKAATGSFLSGKPYYAKCVNDNKQKTSRQWLLEELSHFRQKNQG